MLVASEELSDDRLLNDYVLSRNQEAFAALVRRHGPMVWGVCQRIAGHTHDAEDAFQATFAVLARKAASIRRRRAIGAWLHQVARRTALQARATSMRGGAAMESVVIDLQARPADDEAASDRGRLLDDEIARLPESLRLPIVLCYLEGLTNREAGERLGCPEGTIVSRLARARDLLRKRLVRRGLVLGSAAAVTTLLAQTGSATSLLPGLSQAALQCGLINATGGATTGAILSARAARLAHDVLGLLSRRLLLERIGLLVGGVCLVTLLYFGTRALMGNSAGQVGAATGGAGDGGTDSGAGQVASSTLDGVWEGEDLEFLGGADPGEHEQLSRQARWVISTGNIQFKWQDNVVLAARFTTDPASSSGKIDYSIEAGPEALMQAAVPGLHQIRNQKLEACSGPAGGARPASIHAGLVAIPADDDVTIRAGLAGYARLRRLARSLEVEDLQGKWVLQSWEADGAVLPVNPQRRNDVLFQDDRYLMHHSQDEGEIDIPGRFALDAAQPERFMVMFSATQPPGEPPMLCLYEIEGDTLRLCMGAPRAPRPPEFKTTEGQNQMLLVLKREKAPGLKVAPVPQQMGNPPDRRVNDANGKKVPDDRPP